jgi:hypothetical protein
MIKLIRRNQRTVLTGLTIVSMVMFVVNQRGSNGQQNRADPIYATANGKPIHSSDMANAKAELQSVARFVRFPNQYGGSESLLDRLFGNELAGAISGKPEWFLMLRSEADAAGISAEKDAVNEIITNFAKDPVTDQPLDPATDTYQATLAGVTDCLRIFERYQQVKGAVKTSRPERDHDLALQNQRLEMDVVQISANDFLTKVPPPTTQQIQDQFNQFKDTTPHQPNPTTNPFGFGYKLPIRSKVQYIRVSREAVTNVIVGTKSPYDWEVAARKYYLNNPSQFDLKPPTTNPTDLPSTAPAIPQTFDQARDRVLDAIRSPLVDAKIDAVQGFINSTLNTDYQKYQQYVVAGKTGTEPDSSMGAPYSSFVYLVRLSTAVQTKFGVVAPVNQTDLLGADKLSAIPEVGTPGVVDFVQRQEAAYFDKVNKNDPAAPAFMLKPSQPLDMYVKKDASDADKQIAVMLFLRLDDIQGAQAPADVLLAEAQVTQDLKLQAAYKLAQAQAAALATAGKLTTLPAAAFATRQVVIPLQGDDAISAFSTDIRPIVPTLGDSAKSFIEQAYLMTGSYNPTTNPHPIQSIELPEQARVFVAQLTAVKADWNSDSYFRNVMMTQAQAGEEFDRLLRAGWFDLEAVKKRTGFVVK